MNEIHTPLAVLGGGPAGYVAAIRAAQLGSQAVLVEGDALGGVCMNRGCIPTKALLKSAGVASAVGRSAEFGVVSTLDGVNWSAAVERKNRIVKNLHMGLGQLLDARGVTVLKGRGNLQTDREIILEDESGNTRLTFDKLILATGSEPVIPAIDGTALPGVMTSTEALDTDEIPESIIVIGAGVIGVEFASMFRAAGSKVTV